MSLAKDRPYYVAPSNYDEDLYAWAYEQAQLLRLGRFSEIDLVNIIEEIEGLGSESRLMLGFHYRDLIAALLEWEFMPGSRTSELKKTILDARFGIQQEESDSRSLRDAADRSVRESYGDALTLVEATTGLSRDHFPLECPYSIEMLRDLDGYPESIGESRA